MHRRHVEQIAWETLWIHLGEHWSIDPSASAQRLARGGRGGYCFHLNGGFYALLRSLGYRVARHVGDVRLAAAGGTWASGEHLVLTVDDLPTDANPGGAWCVDVGLGGGLRDPIPLVAGTEVRHGAVGFRLDRCTDEAAGWLLTRLPSSGWEATTWRAVPAKTADFAAAHARLSGSADSRFVRVLVAKRWGPTGLIDLHGLMYTPGHAAVPIELGTRDELLAALADGFGLDLSDVSPGAIDRLWRHAAEGHERWVAAGRP
jgi:arylamine N-acetyltransferase